MSEPHGEFEHPHIDTVCPDCGGTLVALHICTSTGPTPSSASENRHPLPPFPESAYPPGAAAIPVDLAGDFLVVVLTGPQAGAEVTSDGVPWRGGLAEARTLRDEMTTQAHGFGHLDVAYAVERLTPVEPCPCGHQWAEHDQGGCYHQDGCTKDGSDA